jgi:hypothetical protein
MVGTAFSVALLLTACAGVSSSTSTSTPSLSAATLCTLKTSAWLGGKGGAAFEAALSATSAMRSAVASGDTARLAATAKNVNATARRAYSDLPPSCDDPNSGYQLGMGDWMVSALDAMGGDFKGTSSGIVKGAHEIALIATLKNTVQKVAAPVAIKTTVAAPPTTTSPPPTTAPAEPAAPPETAAPTTAPAAPAPAPAPTTQAECNPMSDEGTCYEPGEYCRDDDHGVSGVAGDGEAITCEDNDGWRWEPS